MFINPLRIFRLHLECFGCYLLGKVGGWSRFQITVDGRQNWWKIKWFARFPTDNYYNLECLSLRISHFPGLLKVRAISTLSMLILVQVRHKRRKAIDRNSSDWPDPGGQGPLLWARCPDIRVSKLKVSLFRLRCSIRSLNKYYNHYYNLAIKQTVNYTQGNCACSRLKWSLMGSQLISHDIQLEHGGKIQVNVFSNYRSWRAHPIPASLRPVGIRGRPNSVAGMDKS